MQHEDPRIDPLLTEELISLSESQGIPILATDYAISLKKRVHVAYDPILRDYLATNTVAEALDLLTSRGHSTALIVSQREDDEHIIMGTFLYNG